MKQGCWSNHQICPNDTIVDLRMKTVPPPERRHKTALISAVLDASV